MWTYDWDALMLAWWVGSKQMLLYRFAEMHTTWQGLSQERACCTPIDNRLCVHSHM